MSIKVRIEDKDALQALSWKALKEYLDGAKGWKYAEDIPGKAAVYQHTGKGRRLREVLVPLRSDFADYAARMGDAVGTLARVEDRSELDVYEDLRALGTRMESSATEDAEPAAAVDTATRAVHERIRKWLAEEGWDVREIPNRHAVFSIGVTLQDGRGVQVLQHKAHVDHITIARHLALGQAIQRELSQIPEHEQQDILLSIQRDATIVGVDLEGLELPIDTIWHVVYAYFDGLTKDVLIQRILLVLRVHALSVNTLVCALEKAKRPDAAENLRRRDLRDHPGVSDLLTVAS